MRRERRERERDPFVPASTTYVGKHSCVVPDYAAVTRAAMRVKYLLPKMLTEKVAKMVGMPFCYHFAAGVVTGTPGRNSSRSR